MIRAVTIKNFKNIKDQRIELDHLTVFVGANGSGKTSVMEAVYWAVTADWSNPNWKVAQHAQLDWFYTRGGSGPLSVGFEVDNHRFAIDANPPERVWDLKIVGNSANFEIVQKRARPVVFLRFNAIRLAEPSYSDDTRPKIQPDGSGIASVLAFMALNDPDSFDELMNHVKDLLPQIRRIRFRRVPVQRIESESITIGSDSGQRQANRVFQGEAILFDYEHAKDVAAHTVSEGTLMIVGLLTVLLGPDRPKTLLLDDIEHGLHPLAQKQLVAVIGQIMAKFPDLQILATAHSPYLLNYLLPEQVRIMATDSGGHALCGQLTDHPQFETWKDEMAPGEMWSLFGEKWLAGEEVAK